MAKRRHASLHIGQAIIAIFLLVATFFILRTQSTDPQTYAENVLASAVTPGNPTVVTVCESFKACVMKGTKPTECSRTIKTDSMQSACETKADAIKRHADIAAQKNEKIVLSHRGATEFAPENTLAAYQASLGLGANGSEIDVRTSKDGVLLTFHDDFTDGLLFGKFGNIRDFNFRNLRNALWNNGEPEQKNYACIPSFVDVLLLHLFNNGLLIIELKGPNQDNQVADMLTALDMWDQVLDFTGNVSTIENHPSYKRHNVPYLGLLNERKDVNKTYLDSIITQSYALFVVDDPRPIMNSLKRTINTPVLSGTECPSPKPIVYSSRTEKDLIRIINDAPNWNTIPQTDSEKVQFQNEILSRVQAIQEASSRGFASSALIGALENRVRQRSIHTNRVYHGLDGKEALHALAKLQSPGTPQLIRETLWSADEAVRPLAFPGYGPAHVDWKMKWESWFAARAFSKEEVSDIAYDYLQLPYEEAFAIGTVLYEQATKVYIAVNKNRVIMSNLLNHVRSDVKGRTILELLKYAGRGETWACKALRNRADYALDWIVFESGKRCTFD